MLSFNGNKTYKASLLLCKQLIFYEQKYIEMLYISISDKNLSMQDCLEKNIRNIGKTTCVKGHWQY